MVSLFSIGLKMYNSAAQLKLNSSRVYWLKIFINKIKFSWYLFSLTLFDNILADRNEAPKII